MRRARREVVVHDVDLEAAGLVVARQQRAGDLDAHQPQEQQHVQQHREQQALRDQVERVPAAAEVQQGEQQRARADHAEQDPLEPALAGPPRVDLLRPREQGQRRGKSWEETKREILGTAL